MGLLSRIKNVVGLGRRPDPLWYQQFIVPLEESGIFLTPQEALSVGAVWACIDVIAKSIAACRWNVYAADAGGKRVLRCDDPLYWILNTRPNPEMTAIALREALLYIAIPFGNSYAEIVKNGGGGIAQIWPLDEWRVTPRRDEAGRLYYEHLQPSGGVVALRAEQVFHLRGPTLNGLLGENLIARAVKSISVAAAAERFAAAFFGRGAHPGGVLEHPHKLGPEAAERLRKDFDEKRTGPANAHRTLVLEEGMKWNAITTEPQKAQLVEERRFSVEEICRWFGVPPHKVQHLLQATFSNIEQLDIEFTRAALKPWCRRLEQEADYKLFRQGSPWRETEIDTAPLSYGTAGERAAAHAIWRQNGIMSANEIRAREGLNDVGAEGDVLLVQSNLTTVDKILNPPERRALPPPRAPPAEDPAAPGEGEPDGAPPSTERAKVGAS